MVDLSRAIEQSLPEGRHLRSGEADDHPRDFAKNLAVPTPKAGHVGAPKKDDQPKQGYNVRPPITIAFSWFITTISLWFMVLVTMVTGVINQLITRGHHIVYFHPKLSEFQGPH